MLLGDLITIVQYRLPVKIVVYNNDCLDFIQLEMQAAGLIPWQINLNNPSFAAVADAVGIHRMFSLMSLLAFLGSAFAWKAAHIPEERRVSA